MKNPKKLADEELALFLELDDTEPVYELEEDDNDLEEEEVAYSSHDSESEVSGGSSDEDISDSETSLQQCYSGKDNITKWAKVSFASKKAKTKARNIVKILPGPKLVSRNIPNEVDAFLKFFTNEILEKILDCSNIYIDTIKHKFQRDRDAKHIGKNEMLAFIGLLYLSGVKRANHTSFLELWANDGTGIEIFRACMSYKRFLFILRVLRFDDITTRDERRKLDKLAPIRSLLEDFNNNCKKVYCLSEYMTIDEMLVPFRGRCGFIQYMPNKPAKYGIKIFALCDAKTFYTSNIEIYCGKQPDGPYALNNGPSAIVSRLVEHVKGKARNLTCDNWYSSYPLAKLLLEHKITFLGTLRKNKKEIPLEFLPNKRREVGSSVFGFQKDVMIASYVPKKNKSVLLISTMHDDGSINDDTGKPELIHDYNMTKGGVDTVDQLCGNYSVSRRTKRWPLCIFFQLINISGINSQIIYNRSDTEALPRRLFLKQLSLQLMKPHLENRLQCQNLPTDIKILIKKHVDVEQGINSAEEPPRKIRSRCYICGRRKNRVTTMRCETCKMFVCKEHSQKQLKCNECVSLENVSDNE